MQMLHDESKITWCLIILTYKPFHLLNDFQEAWEPTVYSDNSLRVHKHKRISISAPEKKITNDEA